MKTFRGRRWLLTVDMQCVKWLPDLMTWKIRDRTGFSVWWLWFEVTRDALP